MSTVITIFGRFGHFVGMQIRPSGR